MQEPSSPAELSLEDGRVLVELKLHAQGLREVHAGLMQLALRVAQRSDVEQALLVVRLPRVTLGRIQTAWNEARSVMKPAIARKLAIAAVGKDYTWIEPSSPRLTGIVESVTTDIDRGARDLSRSGAPSTSSPYFFEISKVLLEAWMRRRGPVRVQDLMRTVGCSHPTISAALSDLVRRDEIVRTRDRRVELRGLPRRTLEEIVVRADALRQTHWFVDASGRKPDPAALLRRLQRAKPTRIGLGGVLAARHYDPKLDLHGTPRIDISIWSPRGAAYEPAALARLDPALRLTSARDPDAILAVHRIARAEPLFEPRSSVLPYTDVAEAFLDLHELRLDTQAQALVRHLRGDAP